MDDRRRAFRGELACSMGGDDGVVYTGVIVTPAEFDVSVTAVGSCNGGGGGYGGDKGDDDSTLALLLPFVVGPTEEEIEDAT